MVDFTGLGGISSAQSQQNIQRNTSRLQAAIAQLVSGNRLNRAADDVAALSIATQLQSEVSSLKQASGNIAQASSLAQVADGGAGEIGEIVGRLQSLVAQAKSPVINESSRAALNQEFQGLVAGIDRLARGTSFNGQKLLDGSLTEDSGLSVAKLLSSSEAIDGDALEIADLSSKSLFDGRSLNLLTPEAVNEAGNVLASALNRVTSVRATIGSFQRSLDFAAANIDSAVANQEAARAILQDADFAESSTEFSIANILRNASIAVQAQGNRLSPNLLKLVSNT